MPTTATPKTATPKRTRKPRTPKAPAPLTAENMLATLVVIHKDNLRHFTKVKGQTGSREARIRLKQTGEILAGFGVSREDIA